MFFQEVLLYVNMYLPNNNNLSERQWLASDVGYKHGRRRDKEGASIGVQSDTEWNDKPTDPFVNAILIFTGLQHFRNGNRSGKCQIEHKFEYVIIYQMVCICSKNFKSSILRKIEQNHFSVLGKTNRIPDVSI